MHVPRAARTAWWREPLVHFLALGALLFLLFNWRGGGPTSSRIVITPGQIDSMAAGFARTWQRPPTEQEMKGLLDDYVREEIATREAMALGLDRDDTIIRRRLRQKLEFAAEDAIDAAPPTDVELQRWLDAHPDMFRAEARVAFRQVFLSPERRGNSLDRDAGRVLEQLINAGPDAVTDSVGDATMLPSDVPSSSRTDVARQFGDEFADAVVKTGTGRWAGPIRSGYGLHLVFVRERQEARLPTLAEVRPLVEREFAADRRRTRLNAMYERLLQGYRVTIEKRAEAPAAAATKAPGGAGGAR
jgi:PPIC-type PPIASE domain